MCRRILCLLFVAILIAFCGGCALRGNTIVLDNYSPQKLYNTYKAIKDGSLKVKVNRTETIPSMQTTIVDNSQLTKNRVALYLYNDSEYYATIHGYSWITRKDDVKNNAHKAIYFNVDKEVANSTYEVRIDPERNTYLQYELLDNVSNQPVNDAIYFIFFKYEETEYVGAATAEDFVFWPIEQTV